MEKTEERTDGGETRVEEIGEESRMARTGVERLYRVERASKMEKEGGGNQVDDSTHKKKPSHTESEQIKHIRTQY